MVVVERQEVMGAYIRAASCLQTTIISGSWAVSWLLSSSFCSAFALVFGPYLLLERVFLPALVSLCSLLLLALLAVVFANTYFELYRRLAICSSSQEQVRHTILHRPLIFTPVP